MGYIYLPDKSLSIDQGTCNALLTNKRTGGSSSSNYSAGLYEEDRKPGSGMLKKAIKKWNINLSKSFMIGDKITDKIAAEDVNIKFFYKKEKNLNTQVINIFNVIK